jgi:hypothetical protein
MELRCPQCHTSLEPKSWRRPGFHPCPTCGDSLDVDIFPTLFQSLGEGTPGEVILADREAGCFYHPGKKAIIPCSACGRFLCDLCDLDLDGRHLCPACLETGKTRGKFKNLEQGRTLFDTLALILALAPMLFVWPTIVTPFIVLFITVRYWRSPTSVVGRTRWRFVLASLIAGLQLTGWAAVLMHFQGLMG